jgi:hypothetical protein
VDWSYENNKEHRMVVESIIAFLALALTDVCWAVYVDRVKEHKAFSSALWAVALFISGGVAVISYTTNHWLLIPAGLGAFVGTYAGVWWNRRKEIECT